MNDQTFKPLSGLQQLLYPLLWILAGKSKRDLLSRQRDHTRLFIQQRKEDQELERLLKHEAKIYARLLIGCWTRRGAYHVPRERYDPDPRGEERGGRQKRRKRSQKVQFERVVTTDEIIYYKIKVRRKTLFGTKDALPNKVDVKDLINEDALRELGYACERHVGASWDDTRYGAWVMVYRGERIDALPKHVPFKSVIHHHPADMSTAKLVLGIGDNRTVHYADFASYPHWLIGGSTGSGKSNLVNHIICSLLRLTDPADVKLVLIDLKGMEFVYYDDVPHLLWPIVETAKDALATLTKLRGLIEERKKIMRGKAKELAGYNKKFPDKALPRIICIIDEFAELSQASGSDVASDAISIISSVTNLGRAFGIHVITCTQRPAVEVIPMKIKVNMPLAIAGRVPSRHQSDVILDTDDAAHLPDVKGRLAVRFGANIIEIQSPFISDDEVVESVNIARGKELGILKCPNGLDVEINREGLLRYIIKYLGGSLALDVLIPEICPYAIKRQELRRFVGGIIKEGLITVGNGIFRAMRRSGTWRLILVGKVNLEQPIEGQPPRVDPSIKLLEPPPQLLLLAAPTPEPEPEPVDPDQLFAQFLARCCVFEPSTKCRASDLYKCFVREFQNGESWPLDQRKFGMRLTKSGFKRGRSTGGNIWWYGIRLHTDFNPHVVELNQDNELNQVNESEDTTKGNTDELPDQGDRLTDRPAA